MQPTVWHVMVALLLIAYFFAMAGFFAYLLYGPGIDIKLPSYFAVEDDTMVTQGTSTEVVPPPPPPMPLPPPPPPTSELLTNFPGTLFECEGNKALKAEFREGSVRLALSDGRGLSLPQTTSSEGTTYANTNGSFMFQTKDNSAFIEEGGIMTYTNCVIQQQ